MEKAFIFPGGWRAVILVAIEAQPGWNGRHYEKAANLSDHSVFYRGSIYELISWFVFLTVFHCRGMRWNHFPNGMQKKNCDLQGFDVSYFSVCHHAVKVDDWRVNDVLDFHPLTRVLFVCFSNEWDVSLTRSQGYMLEICLVYCCKLLPFLVFTDLYSGCNVDLWIFRVCNADCYLVVRSFSYIL